MRSIISISRQKLRSNRLTGSHEPVIQVRSEAGTVLVHEAQIQGPSRVVHRPDSPLPCGARVWVETDSEVVTVRGVGSGETCQATPAGESRGPGNAANAILLRQAAAALAARAASEPDRPILWQRLGDLYRHLGELEPAAAAYERLLLLEPASPAVARLVAILRGERLPRPPVAWPASFLRVPDFLSPDRLAELQAFTAGQREAFAPTMVRENGANVLKPEVRWCSNFWDIDPIAEWFLPLVTARLGEFAARLQAPPARYEIRDCKLTHYGDGSHFRPQIDRGPGSESRVFGFVYNFHFPPRRFTGGGLAIYDRNLETGEAANTCTTVMPEQNQLVVLSSHCWHEVLPVRCATEEWDAGRFTLNGWIHRPV